MKHTYATSRFRSYKTIPAASGFILHVHKLKPCRVVIYARVSKSQQDDHLDDQIAILQRELEKLGFTA